MARFDSSFAEQYLVTIDRQNTRDNSWVLIVDDVTVVADMAFTIITLGYFYADRIAATGTKFHEKLRK